MNNMPAIRCQQLTKTFTEGDLYVPVLQAVDFTVARGELVAIVGTSGAGKSTFLQLLGGKDIHALNETEKGKLRNQYLGFVYQFHHLLPEFNALENVCIPLLIRGTQPRLAKERALHYIEKVGLIARQKHRVGELSGGERQRIAIARALVTEPHCVLADEPTGNLDQHTAEQVAELILQLNSTLSTSFVIVTHNRELANKMHRILLLEKGKLQQCGKL
jgi:lipoprotein-releasing system ATP-binding protein